MIAVFLKGILLGLSVTVPLGPIGIICVHRTLSRGRWSGLVSGLGASSADTFFAAIAGFGLSFFVNFFQQQKVYLLLGGGITLVILGVLLYFKNIVQQVRNPSKSNNIIGDYISVFFLTISNPLTIIFFGAFFASMDILDDGSFENTAVAIAGVFSGSVLWWFTLTTLVNMFRRKFHLRRLWYMNRITAILIVIFGFITIASAFFRK